MSQFHNYLVNKVWRFGKIRQTFVLYGILRILAYGTFEINHGCNSIS